MSGWWVVGCLAAYPAADERAARRAAREWRDFALKWDRAGSQGSRPLRRVAGRVAGAAHGGAISPLAGQPELASQLLLHGLATDVFYGRHAETVALTPPIPAQRTRRSWAPTRENYLGRVSKALILTAAHEGAGTGAAHRTASPASRRRS
ncbi:MAG: hypothetical protein JOZ58_14700 [Acetobacteraceae bacterium]|nr:hypothetical protein [Acetobacteraceae bacterium]